jgi:phage tail-like protein
MSLAQRNDPFQGFNFEVQVTGVLVGGFSEVSGLESNTEFEEYKEGGVNYFAHKLPTITKYGTLVLRRGITDSTELYNWYQNVVIGIIDLQQIDVVLVDNQKNELKRWTFQKAFPVKWTGPDLKAETNSIAIESLEIAHQGLVRMIG